MLSFSGIAVKTKDSSGNKCERTVKKCNFVGKFWQNSWFVHGMNKPCSKTAGSIHPIDRLPLHRLMLRPDPADRSVDRLI